MVFSMRRTACALAVLVVSSTTVMASDTVEVKVIGTIAPHACIPSLSAGGAVDYGNISVTELEAATYHDLGVKKLNFSITCNAPAKIAIKAVSGRLGTVVSDEVEGSDGFAKAPITLFGADDTFAAGLGMANGAKVGGYAARIVPTSSQADAVTVDTIVSEDDGSTWVTTATSNITSNQQIFSWSEAGTTAPLALSALAAELEVSAYLNKPEELDLSQPVALDGLTTIEVVYL